MQSLRDAYAAFNERDIDSVLALMCEDVDWPNTVTGGRKRGREAVRRHWDGIFSLLSFHVEPVKLIEDRDCVVVEARQQVSDATGKAVAVQLVRHIFKFKGGLIERMDAHEPL